MNLEEIKTLSESELIKVKVPFFETINELTEFIETLAHREHDYGTCVYAMSLAAQGAFKYIAHVLGVTGFQASCAELDFLRASRNMEDGFMIIDYNKLLYPQYATDENFPSYIELIEKNKKGLAEKARKLLGESEHDAHPDVVKHWKWIASLSDTSVETVKEESL